MKDREFLERLRILMLLTRDLAPTDLTAKPVWIGSIPTFSGVGEGRYAPPPQDEPTTRLSQQAEDATHIEVEVGDTEVWLAASELRLINVSHYEKVFKRKGFGPNGPGHHESRLESLTASGREFVSLSEPPGRWLDAIDLLEKSAGLTFANVVAELRKAARADVERVRKATK